MLESGFDWEIQPGAIGTRLAAADDLSDHESPYFENVSASTGWGGTTVKSKLLSGVPFVVYPTASKA